MQTIQPRDLDTRLFSRSPGTTRVVNSLKSSNLRLSNIGLLPPRIYVRGIDRFCSSSGTRLRCPGARLLININHYQRAPLGSEENPLPGFVGRTEEIQGELFILRMENVRISRLTFKFQASFSSVSHYYFCSNSSATRLLDSFPPFERAARFIPFFS